MPKAFTEAERERIRARLLAAGKRAINRAGFRLLSIEELAREAGISKGSFYSFFPSREDFILCVFESWESEYRGALLRELVEGGGSSQERLERFFLGAFEILEREPGLAKLGFREIQGLMERLPPERLAAHQAADERALSTAFEVWTQAGLIAPDLAAALRGLMPALFVLALHKEDFPEGSFAPTVRLIAEALALRIAAKGVDA